MRIGTVSVAGLAAAVLLGVAFWPEGGKVKVLQAVAQTEEKPAAPGGGPAGGGGVRRNPKPKRSSPSSKSSLKRIDADYPEVPFKELLEDLQQRTQIQIYVNRKAIGGTDISLDAPISINLKASVLTRCWISFWNRPAIKNSPMWSGMEFSSSPPPMHSGSSEVKVYNCRDLSGDGFAEFPAAACCTCPRA